MILVCQSYKHTFYKPCSIAIGLCWTYLSPWSYWLYWYGFTVSRSSLPDRYGLLEEKWNSIHRVESIIFYLGKISIKWLYTCWSFWSENSGSVWWFQYLYFSLASARMQNLYWFLCKYLMSFLWYEYIYWIWKFLW